MIGRDLARDSLASIRRSSNSRSRNRRRCLCKTVTDRGRENYILQLWCPACPCGLTVWLAVRKHLLLVQRVHCESNERQKQTQRAKIVKIDFFWTNQAIGPNLAAGRLPAQARAPGARNFFRLPVAMQDSLADRRVSRACWSCACLRLAAHGLPRDHVAPRHWRAPPTAQATWHLSTPSAWPSPWLGRAGAGLGPAL